jgi:hypothetical protein
MAPRLALSLLVLAALCVTACGGVRVISYPPGAKIYVDGKDSGKKAPATIRPPDLEGKGQHKIEVWRDDLSEEVTPAPQYTDKKLSIGRIVWSILFPPLLILNAIRGFYYVDPNKMTFRFEATDQPVAVRERQCFEFAQHS